MQVMRLGIAHHFGWAVAVTAEDGVVRDRRRIELLEEGLPAAPIHHHGGFYEMHRDGAPPDDDTLAALVADVRAASIRHTSAALDALTSEVSGQLTSLSVRGWPADFPTDIATLRRPPYESRADSVMYCQVLAALAEARGWTVSFYDTKTVEAQAAMILGDRADDVLVGPRSILGPPWNKDHRMALAATIVADSAGA